MKTRLIKALAVLSLITLTGCPSATIRTPQGNPEGYDQETIDHYRTPRTLENPVVRLRVQLDPQSTEYTVVEGRITGVTLHILGVDGDLLSIPVPRIHPEDRP